MRRDFSKNVDHVFNKLEAKGIEFIFEEGVGVKALDTKSGFSWFYKAEDSKWKEKAAKFFASQYGVKFYDGV